MFQPYHGTFPLYRTREVTLINFALSKHLVRDDYPLTDQRGSLAYISPDVLSGKPSLSTQYVERNRMVLNGGKYLVAFHSYACSYVQHTYAHTHTHTHTQVNLMMARPVTCGQWAFSYTPCCMGSSPSMTMTPRSSSGRSRLQITPCPRNSPTPHSLFCYWILLPWVPESSLHCH